MTIPTPALRHLVEQVREALPASGEIKYGDIDGLDRYRSVTFSEGVTEYLEPLLPAMSDQRIAEWHEEDGCLTVSVVTDVRADFAHDFALTEASAIIHGTPKGSPGNPYTEEDVERHLDKALTEDELPTIAEAKGTAPRPRKHAAKKAAKRSAVDESGDQAE